MITLAPLLSQQQRVTPQQVQFLKMLQLPVVALEQYIKQELEVNPLLEEITQYEQNLEDPGLGLSAGNDDRSDDRNDEPDAFGETPEREFDYDEMSAGDYDGYKAPSFAGSEQEEQDEFPQRAEESFAEGLLAQLRMQPISDDELALAEEIIGNIDDDGYLRRDLREIVDDLNKFIAATQRAETARKSQPEPSLGDGHFNSYGETIADEPFGRERLAFHEFDSDDDHVDDRSRNGHADTEIEPPERTATANGARSVATMSLQEMSMLSIEELARLLEQGTSQNVPAESAQKEPTVEADIAEPIPPAFSVEEAERLLHRIQRLDPPGVGARDLRECLMVQLDLIQNLSPAHKLAHAVIRDVYPEFTMKHFEKICQKVGCSTDELKGAIEVIKTLNPKPGGGSSSLVEHNYITPDFVIESDGNDLTIIPNDRNMPILRVSRSYQHLMQRGRARKNGVDRETKKFLREKLESAKWFIASIQQRRQTMMKVMRAIVDLQREFFLHGPDHIRPMIYRDVADRIGMDVSTICRVVNGKYAQTDYGTFELKYFFSEKLETTSGEEVSTKIVKSRIREMIDAEDKGNPLSDDEISKQMKDAGFNVARRTVAKYREQMNIPVARLRRTL